MSIVIDIAEGKKIVPHIVLVGAGGNGGLILQHIAQMMSIFQLDGEIVVADPDTVEEKTLEINSLFDLMLVNTKQKYWLVDIKLAITFLSLPLLHST